MKITVSLRKKMERLSYPILSFTAALAAFGAYTSVYAFRKAFTAATFSGMHVWGVDYKVWLVIAQVFGYMLSKFYGIKFIAALNPAKRSRALLILIGIAWLALLGFALVPPPYNIPFLFINGFPLGMIWGLVFGYLEGRRSTEFMAAILSITFVFASGFVKTIGRLLLATQQVSEFWMPFLTGLFFVVPLLLFVLVLESIPPPTAEDEKQRIKRVPMSAAERHAFLVRFLPGIVVTLIIYVLLTIMRDLRDNFEVEIWAYLGIHSNSIYSINDTIIAIIVLGMMAMLVVIKNNLKAFTVIHLMIISGCLLLGFGSLFYQLKMIGPVLWMGTCGLGIFMAYIPYNAVFFERMIATFRYRSNAGFAIYVADSIGYLGSISVLLIKEFGHPNLNWGAFFKQGVWLLALFGGISAIISLLYFRQQAKRQTGNGHTALQLSSA